MHGDRDPQAAVRRHRICAPAAPAAPWRTERRGGGPAAVHPARSVGGVHHGAVSAPQRWGAAGGYSAGHRRQRDGGPPPDRQRAGTVDAGRHGQRRLHRLHPPRQLRCVRHPAYGRRQRGAAALGVRAVRGACAGKCPRRSGKRPPRRERRSRHRRAGGAGAKSYGQDPS